MQLRLVRSLFQGTPSASLDLAKLLWRRRSCRNTWSAIPQKRTKLQGSVTNSLDELHILGRFSGRPIDILAGDVSSTMSLPGDPASRLEFNRPGRCCGGDGCDGGDSGSLHLGRCGLKLWDFWDLMVISSVRFKRLRRSHLLYTSNQAASTHRPEQTGLCHPYCRWVASVHFERCYSFDREVERFPLVVFTKLQEDCEAYLEAVFVLLVFPARSYCNT